MSVVEDVKLTKELKKICFDFVCNERGALIEELKKLKDSANTMHSIAFLNDIQRRGMEKATGQFVDYILLRSETSSSINLGLIRSKLFSISLYRIHELTLSNVPYENSITSSIAMNLFYKLSLS
ncbi:hypothetical protein Tco_1316992 [Tanacetum coccineum]